MPERTGPSEALPMSAVEAAAALLAEETGETDAAPQPGFREEPAPQPEPGSRPRDNAGRFVAAQPPTPTRTEQPEPEPQSPGQAPQQAEPEPDYRALLEEQRRENERLRNIYTHNTTTQRKALEDAQAEAKRMREDARATVRAEREAAIKQARETIERVRLVNPNHADLPEAILELARMESDAARKDREEWEADRKAEQQAREEAEQQQARQVQATAETQAKIAAWATLEGYGQVAAKQLNLAPQQVAAILQQFQTPELATFIQTRSAAEVAGLIKDHIGHRFHQALVNHAAAQAEANRQQAITEGGHAQAETMQHRPPTPEYARYTRNGGARPGVESAANFIIAGGLEDE